VIGDWRKPEAAHNDLQRIGGSQSAEITAGKLPARGCSAVVVAGLFKLKLLAEA
jgi:hypothetical protein